MRRFFQSSSSHRLVDFPTVLLEKQDVAHQQQRFAILLPSGSWGRPSEKQICRQILEPLKPATERILLYSLPTEHEHSKPFLAHLDHRPDYHLLQLREKSWQDFLPLFDRRTIRGKLPTKPGSMVLQCSYEQIPWEAIFHACGGPITGPRSSSGHDPLALQYTAKQVSQTTVFFLLKQGRSDWDSMTIVCHPDSMATLFSKAAHCCWLDKKTATQYAVLEKRTLALMQGQSTLPEPRATDWRTLGSKCTHPEHHCDPTPRS